MKPEHIQKISELYNGYYHPIFKPLLAEVEAVYQVLPAPIFNEIRAFNDHISRCYVNGITESLIDENFRKAQGHIKRAILDCFKYLSVAYHEAIEEIEKKYRRVDLTTISNGEFYGKYKMDRQKAIRATREARKCEATDVDKSFCEYEEAYNTYTKLYDYILENLTNMKWAKARFIGRNILVTALIVFFGLFSWSDIASFLKNKLRPTAETVKHK